MTRDVDLSTSAIVPTDPILQFVETSGIIDLSWGHPGSQLLPVAGFKEAAPEALDIYRADALNYGASRGPAPLLHWLTSHIAAIDARGPEDGELLVTAGASQGLDMVCSVLLDCRDTILVPSPTYHLALKILRDHRLDIVPVPSDEHGARVDTMAEMVTRLRSQRRPPKAVYIIPTFGNPTSATLIRERREALAELAMKFDLLVIEDDAYRELAYDAPPPPSLWSVARAGDVIRLGSFSKTLAPGLRLGYLTADARTVDRLATGGLLDSGGGVNHFAALVAARFAARGGYARHVEQLRARLVERRDSLVGPLLEAGLDFERPSGGYFVWLRLRDGLTTDDLKPAAVARGVDYLSGDTFAVGEKREPDRLRLSFSLYEPDRLAEAAHRLVAAIAHAHRS